MEAQKEKESQVAAWLKKIFGDHPIPQYEVNPRTTEILYHLSEHNKVRDRDVHLAQEFVQNEKQMKFTKTLLYKGPHHGITLICLVRELSPIIITSYLLAFSTCSTARKNSSSNSICSFSME
uniref:HAUS augmin-like complex subunit 1 n=1 Tax=Castor canadensis TaxID=51338 RepID=A0A8C0XHT0_CASCN